MTGAGYALRRARAAAGLFLTLVALVAVTTGVIAGAVGWTTAAAGQAARDAVVGPEYELTVRTRSASDTAQQDQLATQLIHEAFRPAPVRVRQQREAEFVTYTVAADVERLSPDDLPHYDRGAKSLLKSVRDSKVNNNGVVVTGDLATAAQVASANLAVSRALGLVPLSVLVLVTVLAVGQVARLLSRSRDRSTSLLVARGASGAQIFGLDAVESTVIVALGGALGTGLATGVIAFVGASTHIHTVWQAGGVTILGTWLMVLGMLAWQVRSAMRPGFDADRSGRAANAVAWVTVALVLALAGVALWQLIRTGSPLSWHDGRAETNVVAGAAPALLLAGVGVVAMGLLGPLGAGATSIARSMRGAGTFLTATQTARRVRTLAVPVVLTVLATGATTTAALYDGTSAKLRDEFAAVTAGAPLRATVEKMPTELPAAAGRTARIWRAPDTTIGDRTVEAILANPQELEQVVKAPAGVSLIPKGLSEAGSDPALPVPAGDHVSVTIKGQIVGDKWMVENLVADAKFLKAQIDDWRPDATQEDRQRELRTAVGTEAAIQQTPVRLKVQLALREVTSGRITQAGSEAVEVPGPRLDIDEETWTKVTVQQPAPVERTLRVPVDPKGTWVIDGIRILDDSTDDPHTFPRRLDLELGVVGADGRALFGERTKGWASTEATSPEVGGKDHAALEKATPKFELVNKKEGDSSYLTTRSNFRLLRPLLDTSGERWKVRAHLVPELPFFGSLISPAFTPAAAAHEGPSGALTTAVGARIAMTADLAKSLRLQVGQTTTVQIMSRPVDAVLVATLDAVPGTTSSDTVLVDARSLSSAFASAGQTMPPPTEIWSSPDDVAAAKTALRGALGGEVVVGQASATDPTRSARLIFWVACAGATLLAATGIAVASASMTRERRSEVAVLRAIGAPTRLQSGTRVAELVFVVAASALFGLAGGWLVSALVVPALAQSTIAPGQLSLRPNLTMQWGTWAVTLAAGALALAVVALRLATRVRRAALDNEYREEVR